MEKRKESRIQLRKCEGREKYAWSYTHTDTLVLHCIQKTTDRYEADSPGYM